MPDTTTRFFHYIESYLHPLSLEAARILAIIRGELYLRGVLTKKIFYHRVNQLRWHQGYAHCCVLDTVISAVLNGVPAKNPEGVDIGDLNVIQKEARQAKISYLEHIK